MTASKIFLLVGHAHWGKSRTLRSLTGDLARRSNLAGADFLIRRMSNDDRPEGYVSFMKALDPSVEARVLAAFCPNFHDSEAKTEVVLKILADKGYKLYFFVLERQYGTENKISKDEIAKLRANGTVEVYSGSADSSQRASLLRRFISGNI